MIARTFSRISSGALLLVALPALAGCNGDDANAADTSAAARTAAVTVGAENVAPVRYDEVRVGPALSGSLQPELQAEIRAEMPGALLQTFADVGQRVGAGQVLARIDDRAVSDQALSARSGVSTAETAYNVAARELDRAETLLKAGAIAERQVELARSQASAASAQLANARAMLASADKALRTTQVRAPFAGVIAVRQASAGDVVAPGAPLFTLVDPGSMRLEASVPANELSLVRVGLPIEFQVSGYPNRRFGGRITRVSPTADPATGQVQIVASIPNAGNTLVGGLFAEGRVATESRNALVVPQGAVDERGIRPMVTRVKGGVAQHVEVVLGLRDAASEVVEIRSGLAAGDTVLTGAARSITAGTPVRVTVVQDAPRGQ